MLRMNGLSWCHTLKKIFVYSPSILVMKLTQVFLFESLKNEEAFLLLTLVPNQLSLALTWCIVLKRELLLMVQTVEFVWDDQVQLLLLFWFIKELYLHMALGKRTLIRVHCKGIMFLKKENENLGCCPACQPQLRKKLKIPCEKVQKLCTL